MIEKFAKFKTLFVTVLTLLILLLLVYVFYISYNTSKYCKEHTTVEDINVKVISCETRFFYPDPDYLKIANAHFLEKHHYLYSIYYKLANENGYYDYNITISGINGKEYVVVRLEDYSPGDEVCVTRTTIEYPGGYISETYE